MRKIKSYFGFGLIIFCCTFINAQSNFKKTSADFNNLIGSWQGSLTYLDYSSGKPYTMPANIEVSRIKNTNKFIFSNSYPNEKSANSIDTILVSKDGLYIDKELIKSRKKLPNRTIEIVTEQQGKDGNENKPAIIKHTYLFGTKTFKNIKEVKFLDEKIWIKRHEYSYKKD